MAKAAAVKNKKAAEELTASLTAERRDIPLNKFRTRLRELPR